MEILDKKVEWEGNYLRAVMVTYRGRDGVVRTWESFERTGISGIVVVVPVTADGRLILIKQFRPAVATYVIELPAGLNDRDETPEDCARRELTEETGYTAERIEHLITGPAAAASSNSRLMIFLATGLTFTGKKGGDESEDIETIEVPIGEAFDFLVREEKKGNLFDLKILGLIELARRRAECG